MTLALAERATGERVMGDLRPALLQSALTLVKSLDEAEVLVDQTLVAARADGPSPVSRIQLFRLLRQTYHSIERSRGRRPMRDALVIALARTSDAGHAGRPGLGQTGQRAG